MTAAIETIALRKEYGRKIALHGLDLTVQPGEVFGFLGPNGAGKTTTVKILLGLVRSTSRRRPWIRLAGARCVISSAPSRRAA